MKRIGFYSGKMYTEEEFTNNKIEECCRMITDEQSEDEEFCKITREITKQNCIGCNGCPLSQRDKYEEETLSIFSI